MNIMLPNQYDFVPRFLRLASINVFSNIMEPLAGAISLGFLGHLTQIDHLAGVSLSTTLFNFTYFMVSFLRMGTTGVTAQAVGRDDREEMFLVGMRNGLIALSIGGLLLLLQYPLQQLWFAIMTATPEVKASGIDYFNARIWGAPAVAINIVIIGWFLGREMSGSVLLMSLLGNVANITFDYLFIIRWNWASTGAGLSQAVSQYLVLVLAIVLVSFRIEWNEVRNAAKKFWNVSAFKATFTLNGNIFVKSGTTMLVMTIFTALSSAMGIEVLAENALLLQIMMISAYFFEGIGFATETLGGNFKGQEAIDRLLPLLQVTVGSGLLTGLIAAGVCNLFPQTVFGLLTNHSEVTDLLQVYVPWLLALLAFNSVFLILNGYFAGLALGEPLRNASLSGALFGFAPLAIGAWHFHNNHILLLAMSACWAIRVLVLGMQVPETLNNEPAVGIQLPDSPNIF